MERKLTVGEIFGQLGMLLRDNSGIVLACIVGLTLLNLLLDRAGSNSGSTFFAGIASFFAQYMLTTKALDRLNLRESSGRVIAFWGINLLSNLGIILGFVLLIIPGLFLAARWTAANAALLAEDEGVTSALGRSWAMTAPSTWPIVGALLVLFVPACVVGFGIGIALYAISPVVGTLVMYVCLFGAVILSWLMGVAIYSLLQSKTEVLAEVFA